MKRTGNKGKTGKRLTFLIWGANFGNKGAQSMLFTTVSELRMRFPDCRILFNTWETIPDRYKFETVTYSDYELALLNRNPFYWYFRSVGVLAIRHRNNIGQYYRLRSQFKKIDAVIDISGFALSSQVGEEISSRYLLMIRTGKLYNIPVFLMPQSFGPFEYGGVQAKMDHEMASIMPYPKVIYAREKAGYRSLTEKYGLKNVLKSVDLVLQNKELEEASIFKGVIHDFPASIHTARNVAIIPNMRTVDRGGAKKRQIVSLYLNIIEELQEQEFNVYLVRHSKEDLAVCEEIYMALDDKCGVFLKVDDYDCLEFNTLIQHFDFVIASRYHSIVHAYKNAVPAVALGWAEKYHELLSLFGQEDYLFDVRQLGDNDNLENEILNAVKTMEIKYSIESRRIKKTLPEYQEKNCFDIITKFFGPQN